MSEKFNLEIVTPDKLFLKSEVTEVVIPSFEGELGILKDHIPLITFLRPGVISVKNNEIEKYFIEEGTVEFSNNNLLILTSEVKNSSCINTTFELDQPKIWDLGQGNLYILKASLEMNGKAADSYRIRFGIRNIEVRGNEFLLNGKPVHFKGFGKHEDFDVIY